ncbi:hypothetical protein [Thiocystis violascens]|uniref:hypothetical protein n=1 Tax=Thiocystis violascens TaxID=73141 RepID=UPI00022C1C87|nr:hypothetical protein [Thiocystis violascens]
MAISHEEILELFREVAEAQKETQRISRETKRMFQETERLFPQYAGYRLMGAVAAMVLPDEVARFAYRQSLFVLTQSGDAILIRNDDRFTPKEW